MTSYFQRTATASGRLSMAYPYGDTHDPFRDQQAPLMTMTMPTAPPTFQAFKFEARKTRIDWRLLHGVDINPIVRDRAPCGSSTLFRPLPRHVSLCAPLLLACIPQGCMHHGPRAPAPGLF